jgi:predicted patatin/cPLA2 family phospholipase
MPGLVLEGGTLRAIFSAGAIDALLDQRIEFPYCIGVSAGIANGISYISRQKGRNLEVLMKYRLDGRYVGRRNYLKYRSMFGIDFIFDEIPNRLVPFDWDTFFSYEGTVLAVGTNAATGEAEYLNCMELDRACTILRATCALPLLLPVVDWKGRKYFDGGLSDSIPIVKAMRDGNEKNLIILTQPAGFQKEYEKSYDLVIRFLGKQYPKLVDVLKTRHLRYNEQLALCEKLEAEGRAVVIRPLYSLDNMEKDLDQIRANYQHGYDQVVAAVDSIRALY